MTGPEIPAPPEQRTGEQVQVPVERIGLAVPAERPTGEQVQGPAREPEPVVEPAERTGPEALAEPIPEAELAALEPAQEREPEQVQDPEQVQEPVTEPHRPARRRQAPTEQMQKAAGA